MFLRKIVMMGLVLAVFVVVGQAAARVCKNNGKCRDRSQYCEKELGACRAKGQCTQRPPTCPTDFDPVCGCNGRTYSNACFAAQGGANVAHEGECKVAVCSDLTADCGLDEFCHRRAGDCIGTGKCRERPRHCPRIFDPVCGCDGKTYSSSCFAYRVRVSVAHDGECQADSCESNRDCDGNKLCHRRTGDCHGAGSCHLRPEACPRFFAPVCGCDGKTYSNSCVAASAGVSVAHSDACRESPVH